MHYAMKPRHMLRKIENRMNEKILGINTSGVETTRFRPDAVYYATTDYRQIKRVLDALELQPNDVFVEVGAGKGRVICLAARREMEAVIGIELNPRLVEVACSNVTKTRGLRSLTLIHIGEAEGYNYSAATVIYFFNPFEANVLDIVLHKIKVDRQGPVRLAFIMESDAQRAVFEQHSWLECYSRWYNDDLPVAQYRSK